MLYYNNKHAFERSFMSLLSPHLQSASRRAARSDMVAIGLSAACLVHCLVLPVAAAALPIFLSAAEAEWVHWLFVGLALPASILGVRHAHASARLTMVLRLGACFGLCLLVMGALGWPKHEWETALTVIGGLVLAGTHTANFFANRRQCAVTAQGE